ncbi:MAG: hypothetical protein JWN22_375 [Nocardioides sp.]|jgi:hypothetical protein|nr:hypothetical protein [Nocardioides sp.]
MSRQQPGSVTNAIRVLVGLVVLSGLTALLTVIFRAELVRSWAEGNETEIATSSLSPPAFVPVAIVLFVVFACLAGVLIMFFRDGHGWARVSLSGLVVFTALASLAGLRTSPPPLFLALSVLTILMDLLLLVFLWHRDSGTYLRGAWLAAHPETSETSESSETPGA